MDIPRGRYVVGVDGSADGARALEWAAAEARAAGAGVHVVHVLPPLLDEIPPTAEQLRGIRTEAQRVLDAAIATVRAAGVEPVTGEVVEELVSPALVEAGRDAGLIVLGARGHGAVSGLLLGSVSRHVSQHATCPVVVVRQPAHPGAQRVVVGVDGSAGADRAVGFAIEVAARRRVPLVAVHGWRDHHTAFGVGSAPWGAVAERIGRRERLLAEALAGWQEKYPDVVIDPEAIPVHPARALADASERASLVVVGSRGRGEFAGMLLGSVSQSVLHHAACPVAVVH